MGLGGGHGQVRVDPLEDEIVARVAASDVAKDSNTFLGTRYRRLARRIGKLKALVAVSRSILVIVWNLLSDPTTRYRDLGPDFDTRTRPDQRKNHPNPPSRSTRLHRHTQRRRLRTPRGWGSILRSGPKGRR